jgi:hypothetical protein
VVDYGGDVVWRQIRTDLDGGRQTNGQLDYHLRTMLFGNPRSPVGANLSASHATSDFNAPVVGGGTSTTTAYAADARLDVPERPAVKAGFSRVESQQTSRLLGATQQNIDTAQASLSHGTTAYSIGGNYRGNFSSGTYDSDNANEHRADLNASALLTPQTQLRFSDTWFMRQPTRNSVFNPRQELNTFQGQLQHGSTEVPANLEAASYSYVHATQALPGQQFAEGTLQSANLQLQRQLFSPEWRLRTIVGGSITDNRLGTTDVRTAGETLAAIGSWTRSAPGRSFEVRAGPSVGAVQPDGAPSKLGYGFEVGGTMNRSFGELSTQGSYDVTWANDLGVEGWAVHQTANGGASGPLGVGVLAGSLLLSADRAQTPVFGATAGRSISASSSYRIYQHAIDLQVGISDGISNTFGKNLASDGLFLPAPYNVHQRFALLGLGTRLTRYLGLSSHGRITQSDLPDRPSFSESELFGSMDFYYASLRISAQERYLITQVPGGTSRLNEVFIRVDRVFGSGSR